MNTLGDIDLVRDVWKYLLRKTLNDDVDAIVY